MAGEPDGGQSQMIPTVAVSLGTRGQPVTPVPSTNGAYYFGPSYGGADRKLPAVQHCGGAPEGYTRCVCFKVPAAHRLWSGAAPPLGSPRQRRRPAGPRPKAHLRTQRSPEAVGPSCAQ